MKAKESKKSELNNTHVDISVSWELSAGNAIGYVIYYQSNEGTVNSVEVPEKETESYLLNDLPRRDFYNISIVALSKHLPSVELGSVTVDVGELFLMSCKLLIIDCGSDFLQEDIIPLDH